MGLGILNEKDNLRGNANILCPEILGKTQSQNGMYVGAFTKDFIVVYRNIEGRLDQYYKILQDGVRCIWFSNTGRFLLVSAKKNSDNAFLIVDLELRSIVVQNVITFNYQPNTLPYKFSPIDDRVFFQNTKESVQILSPKLLFNCKETMHIPYCDYILASQNNLNFHIACVTNHAETGDRIIPGCLRIYQDGSWSTPYFEHEFLNAHEIKITWAPDGQSMLILTTNLIDDTGMSYYGKNIIYLFDYVLKEIKELDTFVGPIHDHAWNHSSTEFVIISGFMPAHAILYDKNSGPRFQFCAAHRNMLYWSPLKRFLAIAGFGNLKGDIDIWDTYTLTTVGKCKSSQTSHFEWCPDGRKFLTAILTPKLRVDNQIKVFKYTGELIQVVHFNDTELYACEWLKGVDKYYDRPATPKNNDSSKGKELDPAKPKKIMRLIREEDDGIINKEEGSKEITAEMIREKNSHILSDIETKKRIREKKVENITRKNNDDGKQVKTLENRWANRRGTEEQGTVK